MNRSPAEAAEQRLGPLAQVFLLFSFELSLLALNMAPRTIQAYIESVVRLIELLKERQLPLSPALVTQQLLKAFIANHLAHWRPYTALNRYGGIRHISSG